MDETMPLNLDTRPEVATFVASVRSRLADLPPDEQQELTDGLEADLGDLVAEHGEGALGDPESYTRELRAAAGLEPVMGPVPRGGQPLGERLTWLLDASHRRWVDAVTGLPGNPWEFLQTLRPLWWVLRAWVATELLDFVRGAYPYDLIPRIQGLGAVLLVVAVVVSVQIGRRRVWPGSRVPGSTTARMVLLLLNVFALVVTVPVFTELRSTTGASAVVAAYDVNPGVGGPGLTVQGRFVENIYPYDAAGHPLTGIQLYDQNGKPLTVTRDPGYVDATEQFLVRYPWRIGDASSYNTFPMPERLQDGPDRSADAFDDLDPPTVTPPLAAVSPVSLPGIDASTLAQKRTVGRSKR